MRPERCGASHSWAEATSVSSEQSGQASPSTCRIQPMRARVCRAASVQGRSRKPRDATASVSAEAMAAGSACGRGDSSNTSGPKQSRRRASTAPVRASKAAPSSRRSLSGKRASSTARSSGAAMRMRASVPAISRSATASKGALAKGSTPVMRAPWPEARRKAPSIAPRRAAIRSGKPAASRAPASPSATTPLPMPSRRRCRLAARRMRCTAPRSAAA